MSNPWPYGPYTFLGNPDVMLPAVTSEESEAIWNQIVEEYGIDSKDSLVIDGYDQPRSFSLEQRNQDIVEDASHFAPTARSLSPAAPSRPSPGPIERSTQRDGCSQDTPQLRPMKGKPGVEVEYQTPTSIKTEEEDYGDTLLQQPKPVKRGDMENILRMLESNAGMHSNTSTPDQVHRTDSEVTREISSSNIIFPTHHIRSSSETSVESSLTLGAIPSNNYESFSHPQQLTQTHSNSSPSANGTQDSVLPVRSSKSLGKRKRVMSTEHGYEMGRRGKVPKSEQETFEQDQDALVFASKSSLSQRRNQHKTSYRADADYSSYDKGLPRSHGCESQAPSSGQVLKKDLGNAGEYSGKGLIPPAQRSLPSTSSLTALPPSEPIVTLSSANEDLLHQSERQSECTLEDHGKRKQMADSEDACDAVRKVNKPKSGEILDDLLTIESSSSCSEQFYHYAAQCHTGAGSSLGQGRYSEIEGLKPELERVWVMEDAAGVVPRPRERRSRGLYHAKPKEKSVRRGRKTFRDVATLEEMKHLRLEQLEPILTPRVSTCKICQEGCLRKSDMIRHIKTRHGLEAVEDGVDTYVTLRELEGSVLPECYICHLKFTRADALYRHISFVVCSKDKVRKRRATKYEMEKRRKQEMERPSKVNKEENEVDGGPDKEGRSDSEEARSRYSLISPSYFLT